MSKPLPKPFLERVRITHFRSCVKTSFEPNPELSCLIGHNGSGKTSVLHGIRLLRAMLEPTAGLFTEQPAGRCGIEADFRFGRRTLRLRSKIYWGPTDSGLDEVIHREVSWNFGEFGERDEWIAFPLHEVARVGYKLHGGDGRSLRENLALMQRRLEWLGHRKLRLKRSALNAMVGIYAYLSGISYYGASQFTDPARCPTSFELDSEGPSPSYNRRGGVHAKFVADLYRAYLEADKATDYKEFLAIVGPEGLNLVGDLKFNKYDLPQSQVRVSQGGNVIQQMSRRQLVVPGVLFGKTRLSPSQLSEGTFKTLALIFYLVSDRCHLLLLEEPEVCVHHGLLTSIVELIKTYSHSKQIIFTTHSDFVLDALSPEQVFIVTRPESRGTQVRAISKTLSAGDFTALKDYLAETGNLGEFWRHGGFATTTS